MNIIENYYGNERFNLTVDISENDFGRYFVRCHRCGRIMFRDDESILEYNGYYYCSDCTRTCCCCNERFPVSETYTVTDSSDVFCEECFSDCTYRCADCGEHFRYEDSLHYCEEDECDLCHNCYEARDHVLDDYHTFKNYGYLQFLGDESRTEAPYMGYELEVDSDSSVDLCGVINQIRSFLPQDFYHFEHDGSLSYGFEMISQPASIKYHLSLIENHKKVFKALISNDLRGHDIPRCGLHIHLDRHFFGKKEDSSIAKLLYLFKKFSQEMIKFSRRSHHQIASWCRFRKTDLTGPNWIKNTVKDSKGYFDHEDRYYCLNLTNSDTIEIRLSRSTLNIKTFIATLKFTDRLARLARDTRAVDLAKMSFLDLLGNDEDILAYWDQVKSHTQSEVSGEVS